MSDYVVSARKYRPSTFNTVVGQKALVQTLKNAIANNKLAHAYLFCGPRGVGKTTCARIFAKTINCEHRTPDGEACNECDSCKSMGEQRSYNVYELDAASNNSVDNIRELIDQVQIPPQIGKYKVFIIDEVHMLSTQAFNAFLKTLEEPPKHAIFVMCTTEKQKILPTILSRCQTYDFQRISTQDIADQLSYIAGQENIKTEPQALLTIARKADGGMRDALSVFDQISSFTSGYVTYQATIENLNILDYELFFRLTDAALQGNIPAAMVMLDEVIRKGFDPQYFIGGWASHLRDLMVSQDPATLKLIEAGPEVAVRYQQQAANCKPYFLYNAVMIANDCDFNYRNSRNKRLSVEIAIVRICQLLNPIQSPQQPQKASMQSLQGNVGNATSVASSPISSPMASQAISPASSVAQPSVAVRPAVPTAPLQPVSQQGVQQSAAIQSRVSQAATSQQVVSAQSRQSAIASQPVPRGAALPGRGTSMMASLHNTGATMPQTFSRTSTPLKVEEQNEPIDESALVREWNDYLQSIPSEKILMTAMLNSHVRLEDKTQVSVTVLSEEQQQRIDEHREEILSHLREVLHNTHLQMSFTVAKEGSTKLAFTPRERMDEIQNENPDIIQDLLDTFGLELS